MRTRQPVHVTAEVVSRRRIGAHHHLVLRAPGVGEAFRPGNFLAVSVGEAHLARRPLWIHQVRPLGGLGLGIGVVVAERGVGTRWLAGLEAGARLEVTGPLGRPFALPKEPVSCLLVGEGYAAAPLFPLAERLHERGCPVTLLLAAEDEAQLLSAREARRAARAVTVVTGDGSVGVRGSAADALPRVLEQARADVVYAAGSPGTAHSAAQAAEDRGAWSQVALETPMPCGTGLCHGCPVPVVGEHGAPLAARACAEGPVFRGDRVRWDDLEEVAR